MKFTHIAIFGGLAMLAACASKPSDGYTVSGQVEGLDGQEIYLRKSITRDSTVTDTVVVANGKFEFNGVTELPLSALLYMGNIQDRENKTVLQFYVDPKSEIVISGLAADNFKDATVSGSKTTEDQKAYDALYQPILDQYMALQDSMQQAGDDKEKMAKFRAMADSIRPQGAKIQADFIKANPGSFYTAILLNRSTGQMSYEEMKEAYNALAPEVQPAATELKAEIDKLAAIQPGNPAPDLIGVDQNGQPQKLSDLKGKVVLIDFWATWCVPCVGGLPHVKELYEKYHDKGFEVFMVGDNDSSEDKWKEFIETRDDLGMKNYHHILRGFKMWHDENGYHMDRSNDQSDKYAVHYLPTKYLIAADGTIVGRVDEDLDAKLAEIFAE